MFSHNFVFDMNYQPAPFDKSSTVGVLTPPTVCSDALPFGRGFFQFLRVASGKVEVSKQSSKSNGGFSEDLM
jgi:hypothetical protein